ncbi:MAG TPA: hypothetical protein VFQ76_01790 [Longimicrobiaceae bacterium]|nr:hypothetical protein [Longimicrobiaceae bacterium]
MNKHAYFLMLLELHELEAYQTHLRKTLAGRRARIFNDYNPLDPIPYKTMDAAQRTALQRIREKNRARLRDLYTALAYCQNRPPLPGKIRPDQVMDIVNTVTGCWYASCGFNAWHRREGRGFGVRRAMDWQREFILAARQIRSDRPLVSCY